MNKDKKGKVPIQAFLRIRPFKHPAEYARNVSSIGKKAIEIRTQYGTRQYNFDGVFDHNSTQSDIYGKVVKPMVSEVLSGFNCTIFAYGQTGTGKTYTMAGIENPDSDRAWDDNEHAGIIPRALGDLFDELSLLQNEYTVRVWYLELYNEELYDLLSDNTDDCIRLKLFDDPLKKGSVTIHGIQEVTVYNKQEVFKILHKGQEKRRTAATLMNAQSSRSHTVFCITVHIRDMSVDGEILVKIGKLYLVDLAGSENISRAGSTAGRARETGNINQSLLTLGRVIKTLVEKCPHIPYRESKLTRILQDSLGGHTKTCIIATISIQSCNLDETISTLDYANRARNITNLPKANQQISQTAYLKNYECQLERLRRDVDAARSGSGVTVSQENYDRIVHENMANKEALDEKINLSRLLEEELRVLNEQMEWNTKEFQHLNEYYNDTLNELNQTESELVNVKTVQEEQTHLTHHYQQSANKLKEEAEKLYKISQQRTDEQILLHKKFNRLYKLSENNVNSTALLTTNVQTFCQELTKSFKDLEMKEKEIFSKVQEDLGVLKDKHTTDLKEIADEIHLCRKKYIELANQQICLLQDAVTDKISSLCNDMSNFNRELEELISIMRNALKDEQHYRCNIAEQDDDLTNDIQEAIDMLMKVKANHCNYSLSMENAYHNRSQHISKCNNVLETMNDGVIKNNVSMIKLQGSINTTCSFVDNFNENYTYDMMELETKLHKDLDQYNPEHNYTEKETSEAALSDQEKHAVQEMLDSMSLADILSLFSMCQTKVNDLQDASECCRGVIQVPAHKGDTPLKPSIQPLPKKILGVSPIPKVLQRFKDSQNSLKN